MGNKNDDNLSSCLTIIVLFIGGYLLLAAFAILVSLFTYLPAFNTAKRFGYKESVKLAGYYTLYVIIFFFLIISPFYIYIRSNGDQPEIMTVSLLFFIFSPIAMIFLLFVMGWKKKMKPGMKIWSWYQIQYYPHWIPGFLLPDRNPSLRNLNIEDLIRTL